jgi:hypothetical protein
MARRTRKSIDDLPPTEPKGKREDYPGQDELCVRKSFHNAEGRRFLAGSTISAGSLTKSETTTLKRMKAIERE